MKNRDQLDSTLDNTLDESGVVKSHYLRWASLSLLVGVVVVGSLSFWQARPGEDSSIHRPMTMLEHSGGVLLNAINLANHISLAMHGSHHRYWLGVGSSSSYTTNCVTPGVLVVDYFGAKERLNTKSQPFIRVTAYENMALYNSQVHPISDDNLMWSTNSRGDLIRVDTTADNQILILAKSTHEVITIDYKDPQAVVSMLRDASSVRKL